MIKSLRGSLLVAGTAIGAGMLALPIVTGSAGFLPATLVYILTWLFSICTGLLLLEVCLWMPKESNIISMASYLLGPSGKAISWVLYLFLFYSLTLAYAAGGGSFFASLFLEKISNTSGILIFTSIFGSFVYLGTHFVDRLNFLLMIGLGLTYFIFLTIGIWEVDINLLTRADWTQAFLGLPVIFTSFSFQGIIPSLLTYMNRNVKEVRSSIIIGASIPFVAYILWEFLILGLIQVDGPYGLKEAQARGWSVIEPLSFIMTQSSIYKVGQIFGILALTTSFLGVTLGLLDFLSDGLKLAKVGWRKIFLCLLVYVPPAIIATNNPKIFLTALGYAGGIGCAILLGVFPILMVWVGRYKKKLSQEHKQLPGGKPVLVLLLAFVLLELSLEIIKYFK
jgi:tyrosine-specific transport protein